MDYNNIPLGLKTQTQIPLDVKEYSSNEATLSDLGAFDQLAYSYTKGLTVYCVEEGTRWEWREVEVGEENTGLIPNDFTYVTGHTAFDIDYSDKKYNFFQNNISIVPEDTDIVLVLENDETVGQFHNGDTVQLKKGWNLVDYVNYIGRKSIPAVFIEPSANLTADILPSNSREVGENLTINFIANYIQNDGGLADTYRILKNTFLLEPDFTTTDTITLTTSNINYTAEISHFAGTGTKPNSLGVLEPNNIGAGTKTSNTLTYKGYRAIFYGNSSTKQTLSSQIRTLTKRLENAGNVFNLMTGNVNRFFQFWLPAGINLTSVIDLDALNANITASYTSESLTVNNAGGEPVAGTLYTYSPDVPYSTNHSHQITIN